MEHASKHLLKGTEEEQGQGWCQGTAPVTQLTHKHPQGLQPFPAPLHAGKLEAALLPAGHGQRGEGQPWSGSPARAQVWVQITAALTKSVLEILTEDSSFGREPNLVLQDPPSAWRPQL